MGHRTAVGSWVTVTCAACALLATGCAAPRGAARPAAAPVPPPPREAKPAEPAAAALDPREERRIAKELVRDVEDYHKRLKEKSVEEAAAYVDPEYRKGYQDELWSFVAAYAIESAQVASYQLFPQADGVLAKVKVGRTLFEKGSVTPQKSEVWMTWLRRSDRWVIRPQEQK